MKERQPCVQVWEKSSAASLKPSAPRTTAPVFVRVMSTSTAVGGRSYSLSGTVKGQHRAARCSELQRSNCSLTIDVLRHFPSPMGKWMAIALPLEPCGVERKRGLLCGKKCAKCKLARDLSRRGGFATCRDAAMHGPGAPSRQRQRWAPLHQLNPHRARHPNQIVVHRLPVRSRRRRSRATILYLR